MRNGAPLWVIVLLCVLVAPAIGWLDFHATEVQPAVLLLLVFSAAIAYLQPRYARVVALMLGLSIVETYFVAEAMGKTPAAPMVPRYGGLVALIPASIGAAAGAVLGVGRRSASRRPR
jgi:hypothetical protein